MASQTDCLAAPGSPALSVIWFWGQRLSPLMNIGAESRLPSQKKGSCFHSPGLESLFQESILPARDCKPVSRQKSYVHKYYTFFSSSSSQFYRPAKTSRDALSHSDASKGVITQQWRIGGTYSRCVYFLVKHTSLGFWQDLEDYSLQAANCVKEHWCFVFILFIPNSSSHEPSHYIPVY